MQQNQCIQINCNQTNPYWNSTANQCQPCPSGTVYNYVSGLCEKDSRYGKLSVCEEDRPVWNADFMRCEACPNGKIWNSQQKVCLAPSVNSSNHMHDSKLKNVNEANHNS